MQKKYEIDIAENKLKERLGNLRDTPPTTFFLWKVQRLFGAIS